MDRVLAPGRVPLRVVLPAQVPVHLRALTLARPLVLLPVPDLAPAQHFAEYRAQCCPQLLFQC
jgi:hypothetical protein